MKFCLLRAHCMQIIQIMITLLCVLYVMICNSVNFVWILIIQVRIVHLSVVLSQLRFFLARNFIFYSKFWNNHKPRIAKDVKKQKMWHQAC